MDLIDEWIDMPDGEPYSSFVAGKVAFSVASYMGIVPQAQQLSRLGQIEYRPGDFIAGWLSAITDTYRWDDISECIADHDDPTFDEQLGIKLNEAMEAYIAGDEATGDAKME